MKTSRALLPLASLLFALAAAPLFAETKENWTRHCAKCHGPEGHGDTRFGRKYNLESLADPRKQEKLSDADILKVITDGAKDSAGEETMPAFAPKLSDQQRMQLVGHVRSLRKEVPTRPTGAK